jgi:predicted porin
MKTVLAGTTALAVVALASASAWADLQVKISGFVGFESTLSLSDSRSSDFDRDYDFQTNARLIFDVKNVTDSGLEYGARVRFNSVNRKDGVQVTRTYAYVKGDFGTITFGNAPTIADDIGYVYAHDELVSNMGAGGLDYGELLDGDFPLGGGNFYSIDPTYLAGLTNEDTRIKYTSPTINGFSFGVDFTPVVGGASHAGNGGVNDLIDDDQTFYENVVTGGINYQDTFGDLSVRGAATAAYGNGVQTSAAGANPDGHNLEVYTLGGQVGYRNFYASVDWTHNESIALSDKPVDSIVGDLSYQSGPFLASLSYAYTFSDKGNGLKSVESNGSDLQDNHIVGANVTYTVAPGLNTYAEVIYEKQNFREGQDFENANLITGIILGF